MALGATLSVSLLLDCWKLRWALRGLFLWKVDPWQSLACWRLEDGVHELAGPKSLKEQWGMTTAALQTEPAHCLLARKRQVSGIRNSQGVSQQTGSLYPPRQTRNPHLQIPLPQQTASASCMPWRQLAGLGPGWAPQAPTAVARRGWAGGSPKDGGVSGTRSKKSDGEARRGRRRVAGVRAPDAFEAAATPESPPS